MPVGDLTASELLLVQVSIPGRPIHKTGTARVPAVKHLVLLHHNRVLEKLEKGSTAAYGDKAGVSWPPLRISTVSLLQRS